MARRNKATENAALTWIAAELHSTRPGPAARRVLDFVCDLTRYRTADTKIGKVLSLERDGHDGPRSGDGQR